MSSKTTVYLPDDLKAALTRSARSRGISEAEIIRTAIADAVARPRPRAGFLEAEPFAERAEELLEGFGER
jgi:predicted transcriptional regulator